LFPSLLSERSAVSAIIAALTQSLAKPVSRGLLPLEHAEAAIAAAVARDKTIADVESGVATWNHVLELNIRNAETRRLDARNAVLRTVRALIDRRQPSNRLYAEAHNANEDHALVLTEDEVDNIVGLEMAWAVNRAKRS
jgi:hypothetical protein